MTKFTGHPGKGMVVCASRAIAFHAAAASLEARGTFLGVDPYTDCARSETAYGLACEETDNGQPGKPVA
jgi:hypothetical protein